MKSRTLFLTAVLALVAFASCKKASNTTTDGSTDPNVNPQQEESYAANLALVEPSSQYYFIADMEGLAGETKLNFQSSKYTSRGAPLYWCYDDKPYLQYNVDFDAKTGVYNWAKQFHICFDKTVINESGQLTAPGLCAFKGADRNVQVTIYGTNYGQIYETNNPDTTTTTKPYLEITSMTAGCVMGHFAYPFWRPYQSALIVKNGVFKIKL